jgi:apolipoprotein D and lipocalin family protein
VVNHHKYAARAPDVLRCVVTVFGLVMMMGCMAATAPVTASGTNIGFRNPTAPLGGTLRFDAARFAGQWETIACIGTCARQVIYSTASGGVLTRITPKKAAGYTVSAPGVLRQNGGSDTLVVMWIDAGFRTAVIGDAGGQWAAILDRRRPAGVDRVTAATEILDFNGWDTGKLKEING